MEFEFVFFAGHGILIRVLPPSFLAWPVNELGLLLLPNLYVKFPYDSSFFLLHNLLMRFHAFRPYEILCNFLMSFHAF